MAKKILLSLLGTGAYLQVLCRVSLREAGLRGACAYLKGNDAGNYKVVNSTWIAGSTRPEELDALLRRGIHSLGISIASINGYQLEVSLGAGSAYTGIMRMNADSVQKPTREATASFANAWVTQVWAIPASEYVVRVVPISSSASSGDYLVTCIEHPLFDALTQFCRTAGLRFTKCVPALVDVVLSPHWAQRTMAPDGLQIEMLMERAAPSVLSIVQFVLVSDARPITVLRFWPGVSDTDEFQAIARRIAAQHGVAGNIALNIRHWPAAVAGSASA